MVKYKGVLLLLVGIVIGFVGNRFLSKSQNKFVNKESVPSVTLVSPTETTTSILHTKEDLISLINKFEEYNKQVDAANIIMLFTPPKNPEESDAFIYLNGLDLPSPMFRPYTTANWRFELNSFKIISVNPSNEVSMVEVEEKRSKWNNVSSEWVQLPTITVVFEIKNVDFNYLIENYYVKGEDKGKYNGFYSTF